MTTRRNQLLADPPYQAKAMWTEVTSREEMLSRPHAACTVASRYRAMPPRRRPPEQPAPTAWTPTFGCSRPNSPRRPDLVCQHILMSLSIAAQHSTHQPTPRAATPAPRASPRTRRANLGPVHPPRSTQPPLRSGLLPNNAVRAAIINILSQQLSCFPPPIIIFCHVERLCFPRPRMNKTRPTCGPFSVITATIHKVYSMCARGAMPHAARLDSPLVSLSLHPRAGW